MPAWYKSKSLESGTMIAQELEQTLQKTFTEARALRHEFVTTEHLLLALTENASAARVLNACAANVEDLRKNLAAFVKDNTPHVPGTEEVDTQPTMGFQRVMQRAMMHVQSAGKTKEVHGENVLVALFGEKESHAVYFMHQQGVTRLDTVNFIAHGIAKAKEEEAVAAGGEAEREKRCQKSGQKRPAITIYPAPERAVRRRQNRPADWARSRGRARDSNSVPPPQKQPAAGG